MAEDELRQKLEELQAALVKAGINPLAPVAGLAELASKRRNNNSILLALRSDNGKLADMLKQQIDISQVVVDALLDLEQRQHLVIDTLWNIVAEIASASGGPLSQDQIGKLHTQLEALK